MAKPFDATLKELVEAYPLDWLAQLGLSSLAPVEVIDADLSTVTAQADKVIRVHDPTLWLLHLELQASRDPHLAWRILKYNVLLGIGTRYQRIVSLSCCDAKPTIRA